MYIYIKQIPHETEKAAVLMAELTGKGSSMQEFTLKI